MGGVKISLERETPPECRVQSADIPLTPLKAAVETRTRFRNGGLSLHELQTVVPVQ